MSSANAAATTISDNTAPTITSIMVNPVSSLIRLDAVETIVTVIVSFLLRSDDGLQSSAHGLSEKSVFGFDGPADNDDNVHAIQRRYTRRGIRIDPGRHHRPSRAIQV